MQYSGVSIVRSPSGPALYIIWLGGCITDSKIHYYAGAHKMASIGRWLPHRVTLLERLHSINM